jgi:hypothetical protein
VGRRQAQVETGDLPEQEKPDEEPEEPTKGHELEDGDADVGVPLPGEGQAAAGGVHDRVPGRGGEAQVLLPEYPSEPEYSHGEDQLDGHRISEAYGPIDRGLEARQYLGTDDAGVDEAPHERPQAAMDHHLG